MLVFNNFNFGMTGGQHSTTTPTGAITSTTPGGNLERPLDICATVAVERRRLRVSRHELRRGPAERIAEAIRHQGFALLDIWELCTAYYVPRNHLTKKALSETLDQLEFRHRHPAAARRTRIRRGLRESGAAERGKPHAGAASDRAAIHVITRPAVQHRHRRLGRREGGARPRGSLARAAHASPGSTRRSANDYPVTVKTGHSTSELILSPAPIDYAGVTQPDLLLVLSADGRKQARRYLERMEAESEVLALAEGLPLETRAHVTVLDFAAAGVRLPASQHSLAAVAAAVARLGWLPAAALDEAVAQGEPSHLDGDRKAIEAGRAAAGR